MADPLADADGRKEPGNKKKVVSRGDTNIFKAAPCDSNDQPPNPDRCPTPCMCYVNSRKTNRVGTSFRQSAINNNKSSSVAIGYAEEDFDIIYGSGTIISPNVVITSSHVVGYLRAKRALQGKNFSDSNLYILLDYEYTSGSVDTGHPQIAQFQKEPVISVKREGDINCEDFALLRLQGPPGLGLPESRIARISNRTIVKDEEIIVFQHPGLTNAEKQSHPHMVTRVSAGPVTFTDCVSNCPAIACAKIQARVGSSGGGVFDQNMCLVGVYMGIDETGRKKFVKMSHILPKSKYLSANVAPGPTCLRIVSMADSSNDVP